MAVQSLIILTRTHSELTELVCRLYDVTENVKLSILAWHRRSFHQPTEVDLLRTYRTFGDPGFWISHAGKQKQQ